MSPIVWIVPPQPHRAPARPGRRLLADLDRLADRLSAAGPRPSPPRDRGGGVALQTWMLDHVPAELGDISRELAYLDAQGGRPQGFAGDPHDRNVTLFKAAPG